MPKRPMTISFPKELYAAIDRLAKLQGGSKSALIISFLEPSLPAIENMSDVLERLQKSTPEEREQFMLQMVESEKAAKIHLEGLQDLNKGLTND